MQHSVHLALVEEDAAQVAREDTVQVHTHISASLMIAEGLDIESQQYIYHAWGLFWFGLTWLR